MTTMIERKERIRVWSLVEYYQVYHCYGKTFIPVAVVKEQMTSESQEMQCVSVFADTNHSEHPWHENHNVRLLTTLLVRFASVGDRITSYIYNGVEVHYREWEVENVGFRVIPK